MTLRLHDSASRQVRDFTPLRPGHVGVYVCGLTVQSEPHVGHVRSAVNFDVLRRWLLARGDEVTFVRNVTDIDDKIIAKAEAAGVPWWAHAYAVRRQLDAAYASLNVLPPTYEPLATGHITEMTDLIAELVERGHAYAAADGSGDVWFDVAGFEAYGALTAQGGGRAAETPVESTESPTESPDSGSKRDPRDFALWKGAKPGEPETASWSSPWGRGRPGWHIECSAMAGKYLGDAFDIHGGGLDLRFPHHENELAQSRAAGRDFASYWLHNAWITTAGEKMSKSLGNSLTVPAVLQRVRGVELRFYVVAAHYRSHVEFSFEALEESAAGFRRVEGFLERAAAAGHRADVGVAYDALPAAFVDAMDDDLGTSAAVAALQAAVREGNRQLTEDPAAVADTVAAVRSMLGVLGCDPHDAAWGGSADDARLTVALDSLVGSLLTQRAEARAAKDFAAADAVRDSLKAAGIEVADGRDGATWSLGD
ncbi:cysteine--tRNA ligase [Nocardioidaceae bacterium]|nr:cysteine--tRNA ligase [Nocardioidaceae bacterium]